MSNSDTMAEPDQPSDTSDDNQIYTAEYKDGRLHIVEVSQYDKGGDTDNQISYEVDSTIPEPSNDEGCQEQPKYVQLGLINFALLKNADGTSSYQMVPSDSGAENDDTITCVLSNDDSIEDSNETESYVMLEADDDQEPYMFLQSGDSSEQPEPTTSVTVETDKPEPQAVSSQCSKKPNQLTPIQILEKAKALQKANALVSSSARKRKGKKKKSDLPPPIELLTSPNFKLYLYSCKLCTFKCNAIKEMTAHKKSEHFSTVKNNMSARAAGLQCARCPYRGNTHKQLVNHIEFSHMKQSADTSDYITALQLDSEEVEAADVLVCGACGFESGDRAIFRKHIEDEHGAITRIP